MPYLDNNATTQPTEAVCAAMDAASRQRWANPSSIHRSGQAVRNAIEVARADVAALLSVKAKTITFTASGTESIHLAIRGTLARQAKPVLVTTAIEHSAIRELGDQMARFEEAEIRLIPLLPGGVIDLAALPALLDGAHLASVQWVNNETGVIQPIEAVYEACQAAGVPFHTDATQLVGRAPMPGSPPADLLSCSAHKFHGPKGVGVLYARPGIGLRPLLPGSQELGRRAGTENTAGILGAAAAAKEAIAWLEDPSAIETLTARRDRLEVGVLAACPGAVVNGPPVLLPPRLAGEVAESARPEGVPPAAPRLWTTTNIAFPYLEAEALLILLAQRGVEASAGAACSSGSLDPSPVLLAMSVPPHLAHGSIRFSLSRLTTDDEIDEALAIIPEVVERLAGTTR